MIADFIRIFQLFFRLFVIFFCDPLFSAFQGWVSGVISVKINVSQFYEKPLMPANKKDE